MKKNKLTKTQKNAAVKRAKKRTERFKKSRIQLNVDKQADIKEKARKREKQNREIMKILESRKDPLS